MKQNLSHELESVPFNEGLLFCGFLGWNPIFSRFSPRAYARPKISNDYERGTNRTVVFCAVVTDTLLYERLDTAPLIFAAVCSIYPSTSSRNRSTTFVLE